MNEILSAVGTLIVVIAILFLTYFATKYIGKVGKFRGKSKYIRLIDQIQIGQDKSVALIKVGDRHMLLGVGGNQVSLIKEVDEEELIDFSLEEPKMETLDFQTIIDKMRKRDGK